MVITLFLNGLLGFGMLVVILFCLADPTIVQGGSSFIEIFSRTTKSPGGATVLACIVLFLACFAIVGQFTSTSRQTWSFARDQGLPFSSWLSNVRRGPNRQKGIYSHLPGTSNFTSTNQLHLLHLRSFFAAWRGCLSLTHCAHFIVVLYYFSMAFMCCTVAEFASMASDGRPHHVGANTIFFIPVSASPWGSSH
jgi:hypothetical protein